jgi:hypothetical protein
MLTIRHIKRILLVAAIFVGAGYLHAQPGDEAAAPAVTVPMDKQANITPEEMITRVEEMVRAMQQMQKRMLQLQQVARKAKDILKLNCVNDKLQQVRQLMNIADSAVDGMQDAISKRDDDGRYHYYTQVTIVSEKVTALRDEAENCIGEEIVFLGPTEVVVDSPDILDDPTFETPDFEVERPGYASPFQ